MQERPQKPFKFLVVDDSEFARKVLIKVLNTLGGTLAGEAATGEDAVQKYKRLKPDLVFMDITMPGVEGIDALEMILHDDRQAKVVMVSSLSHHDLVENAMKKGAKHFITKPVQKEPIEKVVKALLA